MTLANPSEKINTFHVGDILVSMWGYDQTNVDFRIVTRVTNSTVRSVAIGATIKDIHTPMSGTVVANPDIRGEKETTSRILRQPGLLKAPHGHAYMREWDGKPVAFSTWA
ncbi:hypothetical protein [Corynebacterium sp.]|uniref:hypothetical protein n=1 Tax=Corynebacterium sp. TaxID=1720 RepID=UPI0028B1AEF6|nr:hypothetical protein [Corynebacterium sp.]